jgi:cyclopropane-fatty-acyl-phospholipid synthase
MRVSEHGEVVCNEPEDDSSAACGHGAAVQRAGHSCPLSLEESLLRWLLSALGDPPVEFVLWNGRRVSVGSNDPVASLRLADRLTLLRLFWYPSFEFAEAYTDGRIEVEGSLSGLVAAINRSLARVPASPYALRRRLQRRGPRRNTLQRSRSNVHHHYDLGNEFYQLWLGDTMAYTCAYYPTPDATLEQAQIAKMDHVCRKLRLRQGESVVEAGCGWGSLALHMAEHYGVRVRAFNISREQIAFARERARAKDLAGRVDFVEDDYRNIAGQFDAFVSVGMLEHVGPDHYRDLGRIARDAIGTNGRGLIHSIGRNKPKPFDGWIAKRIFPGAYPPSLREMLEIFEPWNLSVLDVENLRLHYARTLEHWLERYEAARVDIERMFDARFVRMWRLYLAGSIAAFQTGELQLFQVLFAPGCSNDVPWTREHLYRS